MSKTPGYGSRITIKIGLNRNGQKRATYFSRIGLRWLPLPLAEAEQFLATNQADADGACTTEKDAPVSAEAVFDPVVASRGLTEAPPLVAGDSQAFLAKASASPGGMCCRECGGPTFIAAAGTSSHWSSGMDSIDHARGQGEVVLCAPSSDAQGGQAGPRSIGQSSRLDAGG